MLQARLSTICFLPSFKQQVVTRQLLPKPSFLTKLPVETKQPAKDGMQWQKQSFYASSVNVTPQNLWGDDGGWPGVWT